VDVHDERKEQVLGDQRDRDGRRRKDLGDEQQEDDQRQQDRNTRRDSRRCTLVPPGEYD